MKNKRKGLLTISAQNIRLGLDLAGGVSITYEAVKDTPTDTEMKDTIQKMQQRAEVYSTESSVVQQGDKRIEVDIPGVADAEEVLKSLGKEGSLDFVSEDDVKVEKDGTVTYDKSKVICSGSEVKNAEANTIQDETTKNKENVVDITFNKKGTKKFGAATQKAAPSKKRIYIIYDGKELSSPAVQSEILNGKAQISGSFKTFADAEELAAGIRIGALPLELKEAQSQVVGAQLGLDAIKTSLLAGAIGFGLVVLFMVVFYRLPGLAASIALLFYLVLMLVVLNGLNVTLTLPGVGKSVQTSIKLGFDKALSAIVDGNITTLIAAFVLYLKGSGTIKGFATTLAIGIILSMFTALVITKLLLEAMYVLGVDDVKYFGVEGARKRIPFVANRVKFFALSGVLILACIVMLVVNKTGRIGYILNYGLDFLGGTTYNVTFDSGEKIDADLKKQVESIFSKTSGSNDVVISDVAGSNTLSVKTVELTDDQRADLTNQLVSNFKVQEKNIQYDSISAAVSDEMKTNAIVSVIIAAICMLLYIWFRFKDVIFASSAVLALLHDCAIVLLVYAVSKISVGNTFIACMLTIVGYSINATIVIFDRIRENLNGRKDSSVLDQIVDDSITQTLTRSINTSITTFIMIFMLAILGVDSVRDFAIPLMAGIICGAYSSVCITGTLWYTMKRKFAKKKA